MPSHDTMTLFGRSVRIGVEEVVSALPQCLCDTYKASIVALPSTGAEGLVSRLAPLRSSYARKWGGGAPLKMEYNRGFYGANPMKFSKVMRREGPPGHVVKATKSFEEGRMPSTRDARIIIGGLGEAHLPIE